MVRPETAPTVAFTTTVSALVGDAGVAVIAVIVGAVARTVSVKLVVAVAAPSLTVSVMSAVPVSPDAGVMVTVRLAPLPPKARFALGTRIVFAELPLTVRLPAAVSASSTVKAMAPDAVFIAVLCAEMLVIVGAVLGMPEAVKLVIVLCA